MEGDYTMKEMVVLTREDIKSLHDKLDKVVVQTTKTNGRVSALEPLVANHTVQINKTNLKIAYYTGIIVVLVFLIEAGLRFI